MKRRNPRWLGALALAAVAPTLAACGGGGESTGAERRAAADRAQLEFAKCMRRNGIDMPDPGSTGGGGVRLLVPEGASAKRMQAAHRACREHLKGFDGPGGRPADDAKLRDQALRFAQCMRRNGIDIPDPNFEGGGVVLKIRPGPGGGSQSTRFREAERRCRRFAPEPPAGEAGAGATPEDPALATGPDGG